jgi:glutamate-1-semialdehyde 2,1-aminomutase
MAAGIAQLSELLKPGFYEDLHAKTADFVKDIQDFVAERGYQVKYLPLVLYFGLPLPIRKA